MARRIKRSQRLSFEPRNAFTLIEALVSVTALSVGIVLVLQTFGVASSILASTRASIQGSLLLRSRVSGIALEAERGKIETGYRTGRFNEPFENYRWRIRIDELSRASRDSLVLKFYKVQAETVEVNSGRKSRLVTRVSATEKAE